MRKTSKLRFSNSVFGELQLTQISLRSKTSCCNLKIRSLGTKACVVLLLNMFMLLLMLMSVWLLLNKKVNSNKNIVELKWKILHTLLERRTEYKNRGLKIKLWWVGARESKKSLFFKTFIVSKERFWSVCILSQCAEYWINFQNIILHIKKAWFHMAF